MARILVGSWMIRYPLGGNLSWTLQWLLGFHRLGHEVYLVEKAGSPDACFDPVRNVMSDDCSYGMKVVDELLRRYGMEDRICYVDEQGRYHGLSKQTVDSLFRSADLFADIGTHGAWMEEAEKTNVTILVDGEPGYTQMNMESALAEGKTLPEYDHYFSNGANIGTPDSSAPTAGKTWRPLFNPVVPELFDHADADADAPFTTVMNWQAHEPFRYGGVVYGQKDVEFEKFLDLPTRSPAAFEVAVAGRIPKDRLTNGGWRIRNAHEVTASFDSYCDYICRSRGEFSVCKNVFVATQSGWFSDRSAAYLASGRPVVLQDTGFSAHLPCGRGLFAARTCEEAADAINKIEGDYPSHSRWAREIAAEHLDARKILGGLLKNLGIGDRAPLRPVRSGCA
jgi:hypothetical protein